MRFKNLLGLLAIGGAVAYAQKKRGGDMSFAGIKNSLKNVVDNVKSQLGDMSSSRRRAAGETSSDNLSSARSSIADDYAATSGYSSTNSYGGNGIGSSRKF